MRRRDLSIPEPIQGWTEELKCFESKLETKRLWYCSGKAQNKWIWFSGLCWAENRSRDSWDTPIRRIPSPFPGLWSGFHDTLRVSQWGGSQTRWPPSQVTKSHEVCAGFSWGTLWGTPGHHKRNSITLPLPYGDTMGRNPKRAKLAPWPSCWGLGELTVQRMPALPPSDSQPQARPWGDGPASPVSPSFMDK